MFRKCSLLLLMAIAVFAATFASFAQESVTQIGAPTASRNAFEFIGQIDQLLFNSTTYGYVTYIDGIDTALLFAPDTQPLNRSSDTA